MRYEDMQGNEYTFVFGGGVPAITGTVVGGDGAMILVDVKMGEKLVRHHVNQGTIVYARPEGS